MRLRPRRLIWPGWRLQSAYGQMAYFSEDGVYIDIRESVGNSQHCRCTAWICSAARRHFGVDTMIRGRLLRSRS